MFLTGRKEQISNKIADTDLLYFQKKKEQHAFIEQDKPSEKFVIAEGRTKSF